MSTKVLRIDLDKVPDIGGAITQVCNGQLALGFELASTFLWGNSLVLIFQQLTTPPTVTP